MNETLLTALNKLIELLKSDKRCLGGWEIGSISRGLQDEYSDIDSVFLINGDYFEEFASDIPKLLKSICDEIIIILPKTFNNKDEIRNYGTNIKIHNQIYQFDIFLLNSNKINTPACRLHYADISLDNIFLDKDETIFKLISQNIKTKIAPIDINYTIITYWHHIFMIIKYFKRQDYFKLVRNFDILMKTHIDLLLAQYNYIPWGGWESKLKYCVPVEKQNHLKKYFASADMDTMKLNLLDSMECFCADALEICNLNEIKYPSYIEENIKYEFVKSLNLMNIPK